MVIDVVTKKTTAASIAGQLSSIGFEPVTPQLRSAAGTGFSAALTRSTSWSPTIFRNG